MELSIEVSILLIVTLLIAGLIQLFINCMFVKYIFKHAEANRPINIMILIDQVNQFF